MGFFSRAKQTGSYIFNFRVSKWFGYDSVKATSENILDIGRSIFQAEHAETSETFEEAMKRLNLTEADLKARITEFTKLMIIYMLVAALIFAYCLYIVFVHKNVLGFFMGFFITIYALTFAFRYHFWIYQIKHRKLGCSIREWFMDKR